MTDVAELGITIRIIGYDQVVRDLDNLKAKLFSVDGTVQTVEATTRKASTAAGELSKATQAEAAIIAAGTGTVKNNAKALGEHAAATGISRMQVMELEHSARAMFDALASGANPLRVLSMESGRLVQALGSGTGGVGGALRALAPVLLPIAAVLGVAAVGVAGFTSALDTSTKKHITFMETLKALFQTIGDGIKNALGPAGNQIATWFGKLVEWVTPPLKAVFNAYVSTFRTAFDDVKDTWSVLPQALGGFMFDAAAKVIEGVNSMTRGVIGGINGLIAGINDKASALHLPNLPTLDPKAGQIPGMGVNPFGNTTSELTSKYAANAKRDFAPNYADATYGDLQKNALKDYADDNKPSKAALELAKKFDALKASAAGATASLTEQADALGLSTQAAATMQEKTELLNRAQEEGLKLSPSQLKAIDMAADAYGVAAARLETLNTVYDAGKQAFGDFFSTMSNDLKQGQGWWQAFADAGIKALDDLLEKAIETAANSAFNQLWTGGGGGGGIGGIVSSLLGLGSGGGFSLGNAAGALTTGDPWAGLRLAGGGSVRGPGSSTSDSIPAMLSHGEYVVNAQSAGKFKSLLDAINFGNIAHMAAGGSAEPGGEGGGEFAI